MNTGKIISCPVCGAKYELHEFPITVRDKDSVCCQVCFTDLFSWNGGSMFTLKMVGKGKVTETK